MTKYLEQGNNYRISEDANMVTYDKLPVGTYTVDYNDAKDEFYLKRIDGYKVGKLYGDVAKKAGRILSTYQKRESVSTGVLLAGEKGCGKTLLAKVISVEGIRKGWPTVVINTPFCGETFNKFIQNIDQPCIIIFDEYEKVYAKDEQQHKLLTLLDGVYPTNKLFILTANSMWGVSKHMLNRPGRLFYNIEYNGLPHDFVVEYCADNLKNLSHMKSVEQVATVFEHFNFDMLQAVVEEMNRYGEDAHEAIKMMNVKPESEKALYDLKVTVDGKAGKVEEDDTQIHTDPLKQFTFGINDGKKYVTVAVNPSHLHSIARGVYTYRVGKMVITLKRVPWNSRSASELALVA